VRRRAAAVTAAALALCACGASGPGPPATSAPPVAVPGPASAYTSVALTAGGHEADLDQSRWSAIAPLLAARSFRPPEPLSAYGLDPPVARIVYRRPAGSELTLDIGSADFDAHFVYVKVEGSESVFSVASAQLRPLLAVVGVSISVPAS